MAVQKILLKCEDCGGAMELNEDQTVSFCPFCGSKNFLLDSDAVSIEKIKKEKEIELEKIKQEGSKERYEIIMAIIIAIVGYIAAMIIFPLI